MLVGEGEGWSGEGVIGRTYTHSTAAALERFVVNRGILLSFPRTSSSHSTRPFGNSSVRP